MQEFVFLPDYKSKPEESFATLVSAMASSGRIGVSPRQLSARAKTFSEPTVALASSMFDAAAPNEDSEPVVEMIDYVEKTGVALLRAEAMPSEDQFQSGSIVPVYYYQPAIANVRIGRSRVKINSGPSGGDLLQVRVLHGDDKSPVINSVVNLRRKGKTEEISAVTDDNGIATFGLRASSVSGGRLVVEPGFGGHWGYLDPNASFTSGDTILIDRIDLTKTPDAFRYLMTPGNTGDGSGVRVGVVDSGVGPHPDLPNAVGDEDSNIGHGSHVAGIIGGHGGNGLGGLAPGVVMESYRVFDDPSSGLARNFDIHRAIEEAIKDGCHIINLSLKLEYRDATIDDPVLSRAVMDAAEAGVLCVGAAGNDFRRFVAFPARHPDVVAVSASGWEPGLPSKSFDRWTITNDRSSNDQDVFFAKYSNEGVDNTEVDLIGPGSGVISTVPGNAYAPMSGTSMACPAMVGAISRLLSNNPHILDMPADRNRTNAILELIQNNLQDAGFSSTKQGAGTLR